MYPKDTKPEVTKNPIAPQGITPSRDPTAYDAYNLHPDLDLETELGPTVSASNYGSSWQTSQDTQGGESSPKNQDAAFYSVRRMAFLALTIVLLTMGGAGIFGMISKKPDTKANLANQKSYPSQIPQFKDGIAVGGFVRVNNDTDTLVVNGDLFLQGSQRYYSGKNFFAFNAPLLSANRTYQLPDGSGTVCLDTNNCGYVSLSQLNLIQSRINAINNQPNTASSLNGVSGAVSLQGTPNQVIVSTSGGTVTFSAPQDIGSSSSPTFNSLTLSGTGVQNGFSICDSSNNCGYASSIGSGTGDVNQGGNSFGATMALGTIDNFGLNLKTNNQVVASFSGTGTVTFQNSANNANAFRILDSSSASLFTVNTIAGTVTITGLSGSGANLTNLNASNVGSGTLNDARLSTNVTVQGNTFNGNSQLVQTTAGGLLPVLSGANLTNLNGSNISTGTISDGRLSANVALLSANQTFAGNNTFSSASNSFTGSGAGLTALNGSNISTGTVADARLTANVTLQGNAFNGANQLVQLNGSGQLPAISGVLLTNLNASNIASGTLNDARLSGNVTVQGNSFNGNSQLVQTTAGGLLPALSGANLTSLNATNLSSGTVNDARLSANVALLNGTQIFTGHPTFANTADTATAFQVQNAGGNNILTVDTSGAQTVFGKASTIDGKVKFNSVSGSGSISLVPANPGSSNYTITLPSETGTVCTTASVCAGYGAGSGSNNYIQNQTASTQSADFKISGTGTANAFVQNGNNVCDTSGNCVGVGGGAIGGSGTAGKIAKFTGSGYTVGDSIISESGTLLTVAGDLNLTSGHTYQINGSQISSANLSNDANIAKLNIGQTFTGANTFSNAGNSFTGDGSGLTGLNAGNVSSGTLSDGRLSANVALLGSNQSFSGNNNFNGNTILGDASTDRLTINAQLQGGSPLIFQGATDNSFTTSISLTDPTSNNTINLPNASGTFAVSASGNIALDALGNITLTGLIPIANGGTNANTAQSAINNLAGLTTNGDLLYYDSGNATRLARGSTGQCLTSTAGSVAWASCAGVGSGSTLQAAYDNGNTISTTNNRDLAITLTDQTTDPNLLVNIATGSTGRFAVQNNGTDVFGVNNNAIALGANTAVASNQSFTANGTALFQSASNSTTAFQIQNAAGTSNLLIADTANSRIGVGKAPTQGALDVNGTIYQSGNQVCDTSGNCVGTGGSAAIGGGGTTGTIALFNGSGYSVGDSIITQSGGTISIGGDANVTGQYQVNGAQISSADLSDNPNLAKLNGGGPQTFTGDNRFRNSSNSSSAFQIQDSIGANVLNIDTTNKTLRVSDLLPEDVGNISLTSNVYKTIDTVISQVGRFNSMKLGSDGYARIAYLTSNADTGNTEFNYIRCLDASCNTTTIPKTIDPNVNSMPVSLALGADGFARISYTANGNLRYAHCTDADCSSPVLTTVDSSPDTGYNASLVLGADGFARISYVDSNNNSLQFARCNDNDCSAPIINAVDNTNDPSDDGTSIALGTDGFARISYVVSGEQLVLARCLDADCASVNINPVTGADNIDGGTGTSLVIGSDGFPRIVYADTDGNSWLRYSHCTDVDCSAAPDLSVIDNESSVDGYMSQTLGVDGFARISYWNDTDDLMYARCTNNTCSASNTTTVDYGGSGFAGQYSSIALGSDGFPRIAYYSDEDFSALKYAKCVDDDCTSTITTLDRTTTEVGYGQSMKLGTDGFARISYGGGNQNGPGGLGSPLTYSRCLDADCSAKNTTTIDASIRVNETSLSLGTDGFARITYANYDSPSIIKYARCTNSDCTSRVITVVALPGSSNDAVYAPVIGIGTDGFARLAYEYEDGNTGYVSVVYARCNDDDCTAPTFSTVNDGSSGSINGDPSIAIGTDGFARIGYQISTTAQTIEYARCNDNDCTAPVITTVYDGSLGDGERVSITMGTDGFVRMSYVRYNLAFSSVYLEYLRCNDDDCTAPTTNQVDSSGSIEWDTRITMGTDGFARIGYTNNGGSSYARCNDDDCTVPVLTAIAGSSQTNSIVVGSDGFARISYVNWSVQSANFVRCLDDDCISANANTLDTSVSSVGRFNSTKLGSDGFGRVAYTAHNEATGQEDLRYLRCLDSGCHTTTKPSFIGNVQSLSDFELYISGDGFARIAYADPGGDLRYATCTNADCTSPVDTAVDGSINGVYAYNVSVTVGSEGFARIAYADDNASGSLLYARCNDAACSSPILSTVAASAGVSNSGPTAIALGTDGFARLSYTDASNNVNYARCNDNNCTAPTITAIDSTGFLDSGASLVVGADGFARISYVLYDSGLGRDVIKYVLCNDDDCTSPTITTANSSLSNSVQTPSLRLGSDGFARLAYADYNNSSLVYTRCNDDGCTSPTSTVLDTNVTILDTSLVIAPDGFGRISYYDSNMGNLKFIQCLNDDCTGKTATVTESKPSTGYYSSIKLGSDGFARISYVDDSGNLKYARCTNSDCTSPVTAIIDSLNDTNYTSIAIGTDGFARISYYASNSASLRFARCTDADCTSPVLEVVDSGDVGQYNSLVLGTDGFARISYYDSDNGNLKYARCTDADCSGSNKNTISDPGHPTGHYSSLALGTDGFARISYINQDDGDLSFARCLDADCGSANVGPIDSNVQDDGTSLALGTDGFARISYVKQGEQMAFTRCLDDDCGSTTINNVSGATNIDGGAVTSLALGTDGFARIAYSDSDGSDSLRFAYCTNADCSGVSSLSTVDSNSDLSGVVSQVLGTDGFARIAYNDNDTGSLKYVRCTSIDCNHVENISGTNIGSGASRFATLYVNRVDLQGGTYIDNTGRADNFAIDIQGDIVGSNYLRAVDNTSGITVFSLNSTNFVFQPTADSTDIFSINDSSGSNIFNIDSDNSLVSVNGSLEVNESITSNDGGIFIGGGGSLVVDSGDINAPNIYQNGNQVCDTSGNCVGGGTPVSGSGTVGKIPIFIGASSLGDSNLSLSGSTITSDYDLGLIGGSGVGNGTGGTVTISGGANQLGAGYGGDVNIYSGTAGGNFNGNISGSILINTPAPTNGSSGDVTISTSTVYGNPGDISLSTGGSTNGYGGTINLSTGYSFSSGGGGINLVAGDNLSANPWTGGAISLTAGHGGSFDGSGGDISFITGAGGGGSGSSGNLILGTGVSGGSYGSTFFMQGSNTVAYIASGGATTFQNSSDSANAFSIQNTSGNSLFQADTLNSQITLGNNSGELNAWQTSANSLPAGRATHTSITANGYVYVVGGVNGCCTALDTVYYAKLNADGSTGAWQTNTNALPAARLEHSTIIANGYMYVIGGYNSSAETTVYYAKLNADGSTGAWQTNTNALPAARHIGSSVTSNGYVYVIGGDANPNSNPTTTVYYAKLNADGSTGAWQTNTNALPTALELHTSVVANGYLYTLGGVTFGFAPQDSVYYAKLNADGSTGTWNTANNLPATQWGHSTVVSNGYVYSMGGTGAATSTFYAKLNADGSTGTWNTANNTFPVNMSRQSSVISNGYIYAIGGDVFGSYSTVYYASIAKILALGSTYADDLTVTGGITIQSDALLQSTTNSTTAFQIQNQIGENLFQVDSVNNQITIGGNNSGELNTWKTSANALPVALNSHSSVTANGYVYVLAGYDGSSYVSTVYYAKLNTDGSNGSWTTSANALPAAFQNEYGSMVANGYLYVMGGYDGGFRNTIYYTKLNPDGSTGAWQTNGTSLPTGMQQFGLASANGFAYLVGGQQSGGPLSSTYYAKLNANGSVGSWTSTSSLPAGRVGPSTTISNGYIYAIAGSGGCCYGSGYDSIYYATLNFDGTVGTWQTATNSLPQGRQNQTISAANGYLYIMGGESSNVVSPTVYFAKLNADGSPSIWTANSNSMPGARTGLSSVASNGYIYALGGAVSGLNGGVAGNTSVFYTSTQRISLGGSVDLVGLGGSNLSDEGGTGGSLTAGNTNIVGSLGVQGQASFAQGVVINGNFSSNSSALFQNSTDSSAAFQIQNASGAATLFGADTTNLVIKVAGTTSNFATLLIDNAHFKSTQDNAPTAEITGDCGFGSPTVTLTAGSTDSAGSFDIAAGSGPGVHDCETVFTFEKAYGAAPKAVIITPTTAIGSAIISTTGYVTNVTSTTFTVSWGTTGLGGGDEVAYYYWIVE